MAVKHPKPVAVCAKCGKVSYDPTLIDQQCGQRINRDRCKGLIHAIDEEDWIECRTCFGEGCAECKGVG